MLHLAQVRKNLTSDGLELQLLAMQTDDEMWALESRANAVALAEPIYSTIPYLNEGLLVLVELDESGHILAVKEAKDWVVELVQKSLPSDEGANRLCVEDEEARIEQWRQELTSQSQDLTRRNLEIETRREQIQALKATLDQEKSAMEQEKAAMEQEKEQLRLRWQEIKEREN
ncbi:MAG: hypothetical protein SW833_08575 [Cyanobacteriota bacterium]|nr:hypothetical protein [Cyanobacteriota bacterium]